MGKKKKIDKREWNRGLMNFAGDGGGSQEAKKLLKRYGVEGYRNGRTDRGSEGYRGASEIQKDLRNAMAQDYDTRRTLESLATSGNKKAKKLIKSGFKSPQDMADTQNFFEKRHKKEGGGGDFSSVNDYMNLTQASVQKDRKKHTDAINDEVNGKVEGLRNEFLEKLKEQQKTQVPDQEESVEVSDRLANARNQVAETEGNAFGNEAEAPDQAQQDGSIAQQMLSNYKKRIADSLSPASSDGL